MPEVDAAHSAGVSAAFVHGEPAAAEVSGPAQLGPDESVPASSAPRAGGQHPVDGYESPATPDRQAVLEARRLKKEAKRQKREAAAVSAAQESAAAQGTGADLFGEAESWLKSHAPNWTPALLPEIVDALSKGMEPYLHVLHAVLDADQARNVLLSVIPKAPPTARWKVPEPEELKALAKSLEGLPRENVQAIVSDMIGVLPPGLTHVEIARAMQRDGADVHWLMDQVVRQSDWNQIVDALSEYEALGYSLSEPQIWGIKNRGVLGAALHGEISEACGGWQLLGQLGLVTPDLLQEPPDNSRVEQARTLAAMRSNALTPEQWADARLSPCKAICKVAWARWAESGEATAEELRSGLNHRFTEVQKAALRCAADTGLLPENWLRTFMGDWDPLLWPVAWQAAADIGILTKPDLEAAPPSQKHIVFRALRAAGQISDHEVCDALTNPGLAETAFDIAGDSGLLSTCDLSAALEGRDTTCILAAISAGAKYGALSSAFILGLRNVTDFEAGDYALASKDKLPAAVYWHAVEKAGETNVLTQEEFDYACEQSGYGNAALRAGSVAGLLKREHVLEALSLIPDWWGPTGAFVGYKALSNAAPDYLTAEEALATPFAQDPEFLARLTLASMAAETLPALLTAKSVTAARRDGEDWEQAPADYQSYKTLALLKHYPLDPEPIEAALHASLSDLGVTSKVIRSQGELEQNARAMSNCTAGFHSRLETGSGVMTHIESADGQYNAWLERSGSRWALGEVNSKDNSCNVPDEVRRALEAAIVCLNG